MAPSQTKISVCIPVYNGAPYIAEAIRSVLGQSHANFELIIVDNNSTDETIDIIQRFNDPRVRLFKNDRNIGMVPNWNLALKYSTGEYIKILPADDKIYEHCLLRQAEILDLDSSHKISLVSSARHIINDSGKVLFTRRFSSGKRILEGKAAINKVIRSGGNCIGEGGAVLFRRSILETAGNFSDDIFYVLDLDLWFRILLHGKLCALPEVLAAFRVSPVSESVKVANSQKADYLRFVTKIYNEKTYGLTWLNYKVGLITTSVLTWIKRLIYRFFV